MRTLTYASLFLIVWATSSAAQTGPIALPTLTGPVPVTKESGEPFRGVSEQPVAGPGLPLPVLIPYGYIEEEYFVSGTVDGKPYSTSMLVRRPKEPHKFSGLRTPYVDTPTVRYIAARSDGTGAAAGARRMIGLEEPIQAATLKATYKSRADYLKRFNQQIDKLVSQRLVLPKDGEKLKAEEAKLPLF